MRRGVSIAMFIFGLNTLVTGIQNFFPPFNTVFYIPHVVNASLFASIAVIHVWLNWKSLVRHFQRLGRWWILVGLLGVVAVIWLAVIAPIVLF